MKSLKKMTEQISPETKSKITAQKQILFVKNVPTSMDLRTCQPAGAI